MENGKQNRIDSLDMMRGFSILGIFVVNMLSFHSPLLYLDPLKWWPSESEQIIYSTVDILAQGSFYPLFSLLFGYGLVLLSQRTAQRGLVFYPIAMRRLFLLLLIGLIHMIFIWHGDILINYALLGFLFLFFLRMSGKWMCITGSLLWIIPNLFNSYLFYRFHILFPGDELSNYNPQLANQSVAIYGSGTYIEIMLQRFQDWHLVNGFGLSMSMLYSIFPYFLLGGGMAKLAYFENIRSNRIVWKRSFLILLLLGLFLKLTPYLFGHAYYYEYIQDMFGGPLLAFTYAAGIALWRDTSPHSKILNRLAAVGRMSMTNYLLQSVLCTLLFYSYGLGFYNKVTILEGTILVLLIYSCQVALSSWWLNHHRYGPVEWLWRSATYLKIQAWKKD